MLLSVCVNLQCYISLSPPQDFAELIKEITASNSTIRMLPATKDDPKQRKPDITTANTQIGWKPVVPVRIGLTKAIEYFRSVSQSDSSVDVVLMDQPCTAASVCDK